VDPTRLKKHAARYPANDRLTMSSHRVTDELLARLETGGPWQKPWNSERNLATGATYRGANAVLLATQPYASPWWLTSRDAQRLGGIIKEGERGTPLYWTPRDEPDNNSPALRPDTVFNLEQCARITAPPPPQPHLTLERIATEMPAPPRIEENWWQAAYQPEPDTVYLPSKDAFDSPENYYATLFHELIHSTGHKQRLNRDGITRRPPYDSPLYAQEELTAEIGAAFLCSEAGIAPHTIDIAAQINDWLKELHHPATLIQAANDAQRGADHILRR